MITTIPAEAEPYIQALRRLIRTGVEAAPLLHVSPLLDLSIVARVAGPDTSSANRCLVFIDVLQQVVTQRLSGKDRQTAQLLFAIGEYAGMPMQDRYHKVAKLYHPHWTWDNYRKEPLTRHLLAVYNALQREAAMIQRTLPNPLSTGMIGQDWEVITKDVHYILPAASERHVKLLETLRLRATIDNATYWRQRFRWLERGTSELPRLELFGDGKAYIIDDHQIDDKGHRFIMIHTELAGPVTKGEEVTIRLIKYVPVAQNQLVVRQHDWYGFTQIGTPAVSLKTAITFPPDKRPKQLWLQEDVLDGITRPGEPNANNQLSVDENGYVEAEWHNTSAGYAYGISLRWY